MSDLRRNLGYKKLLECVQTYYKIRYSTAKYLYFRGLRAIRKDEHKMPLSREVQTAIILSDDIINWSLVNIGEEVAALQSHGIEIKNTSQNVEENNIPLVNEDSKEHEWITIIDKKTKRDQRRIQKIITDLGLHL